MCVYRMGGCMVGRKRGGDAGTTNKQSLAATPALCCDSCVLPLCNDDPPSTYTAPQGQGHVRVKVYLRQSLSSAYIALQRKAETLLDLLEPKHADDGVLMDMRLSVAPQGVR
jgi:hypothetical protein